MALPELGGDDLAFDLTGDGKVTAADLDHLVADEIDSLFGDADLDGVVDGQDFLAWNSDNFNSGVGGEGGNFNGDDSVEGAPLCVMQTCFSQPICWAS